MPVPHVSLIATVLNEEQSLPDLLRSLAAQTQLPDEVIIVDAGSKDRTVSLLRSWAAQQPFPVRILSHPGCNISTGRNLAIEAANYPIIAATDAGVTLDPRWLAALTAPFGEAKPPDVVAGMFQGQADTLFQAAMTAAVLPSPEEIREGSFLPSSRSVAFTKEAWRGVGGYPEWADYSEDLLFDMALLAAGYQMQLARSAIVSFPPRRSFSSYWRQYHNYAKGDGQTNLFLKRHLTRYGTYFGIVPLLAWLFFRTPLLALLGYLLGAAVYLARPLRRWAELSREYGSYDKLKGAAYIPLIRFWGDLAKMYGYPTGLPKGLALKDLNAAYKSGKMRRIVGRQTTHN